MSRQHLALAFLFLTYEVSGEICKCQVKTDRVVTVPDCGQGFPNKRNSLAKGKTAASIFLNQDSKGEILTATPNPFSHSLTISFKNNKTAKEIYNLSLLNSNGSTVITKSVIANTTVSLSTEAFPAGTYLLTLRSHDGTVKSIRVVKVNQ